MPDNGILILITVFVIVIVIFLMTLMVLRLKRVFSLKKKIEDVAEGAGYMNSLLITLCGRKNVLKNIYLPVSGSSAMKLCKSDYIVVNPGGVIVITVKAMKGYIENPMRGDWRQFYGDRAVQFENPFEKNATNMRAVNNILKSENMLDIPIKSIIVFTSSDVEYKNRFSQIVSPERAVTYIDQQRRTRVIDRKQIDRVLYILNNHRKNVMPDQTAQFPTVRR